MRHIAAVEHVQRPGQSAGYSLRSRWVKVSRASLSDEKIDEAIAAINDKRTALLAGKSLSALPNDKMVKYLQLGDARRALRNKSMEVRPDAAFLAWVTHDLLPVLIEVGKVVIDLLL